MSATTRQAADAGKQLAHQFRSLAVLVQFFEENASLEQVAEERKTADEKSKRDHAALMATIEKEKATVAAQLKAAQTALAKVEADREAVLAEIKTAKTAGKRTLAEQKVTIAARMKEIADLDDRLAASKRKVAEFMKA